MPLPSVSLQTPDLCIGCAALGVLPHSPTLFATFDPGPLYVTLDSGLRTPDLSTQRVLIIAPKQPSLVLQTWSGVVRFAFADTALVVSVWVEL